MAIVLLLMTGLFCAGGIGVFGKVINDILGFKLGGGIKGPLFEYVEGEAILLHMNQYGICASSGSACTSGSLEPSHVLRAMGVPFTAAHGSIRFSLSVYNTEEEVDFVLEKMPPIIAELRELSPFWKAD